MCTGQANTHFLDNLWQRSSLETYPRIPLCAKWCVHAPLKLRFTCIRIRQVLDLILGCFFIAPLGNDNMDFFVVCAGLRVNTGYLLDKIWLKWGFARACTTPRTLEFNCEEMQIDEDWSTHPACQSHIDLFWSICFNLSAFLLCESLCITVVYR